MKKIFTFLAVCAMLCSCTTDWGTLETVNYPINGEYHALNISNAFQVTTSETATDAQVTIGEKAHPYVQVEVIDGTLFIGLTKWNFSSLEKATVVIPAVSSLNHLRLSGASSFNGDMSADEVDVRISGASMFEGAIYADQTNMELNGASEAVVHGYSMEDLKIGISGASKLDGISFPCTKISGEMSGASKANVTCCESLKMDLSGASELLYGTPGEDCNPTVDCRCTGASTIAKR